MTDAYVAFATKEEIARRLVERRREMAAVACEQFTTLTMAKLGLERRAMRCALDKIDVPPTGTCLRVRPLADFE